MAARIVLDARKPNARVLRLEVKYPRQPWTTVARVPLLTGRVTRQAVFDLFAVDNPTVRKLTQRYGVVSPKEDENDSA